MRSFYSLITVVILLLYYWIASIAKDSVFQNLPISSRRHVYNYVLYILLIKLLSLKKKNVGKTQKKKPTLRSSSRPLSRFGRILKKVRRYI